MDIVFKIAKLLIENNLTISCCESASGGYLSHLLTSIDGSSKYFKGAIISYSNEVKQSIVKVNHQSIVSSGAISQEVAEQMAMNTNKLLNTDICVAITGNASTNNLIEQKASCLFYIGICIIDKTYVIKKQLEPKERNENILNISYSALEELYNLLTECLV